MIFMDVDTALSEVPVNAMPLLDDTDFKSIEASVAYNASGMALYWHFVTSAGVETTTAVTPTTGGTYDWAHAGQGMYTIEIPASGGASINNDTEGYGYFTGVATGVLPWRGPTIGFRAAAINDSLCDAGATGLLAPTTAGRTLDVSAGGEAGLDWANVGSPTTTLALTGTTIATTQKVDVETIKTNPVVNAGTVTFPTTATLASTTNITAGTIATVSGNVTGNVGGNVMGSVGSIATGGITTASFAAGAIDAAAIAANAIGASELAADAVTEIQSGLATASAVSMLQTDVTTLTGYVDTEVAAIKAKTDSLPADPADASDIAAAFSTVNSTLATIAAYVDTEVAAIKAKTDSLTFTVAGKVDANMLAIAGSTTAATNQSKAALAIYPGTVTTTGTTTTLIDTGLTQVDDHWIGRVVIFLTGTLAYQATTITDFVASTDTLTMTALTSAPQAGDTYLVV